MEPQETFALLDSSCREAGRHAERRLWCEAGLPLRFWVRAGQPVMCDRWGLGVLALGPAAVFVVLMIPGSYGHRRRLAV
jgi:hypothetical protein